MNNNNNKIIRKMMLLLMNVVSVVVLVFGILVLDELSIKSESVLIKEADCLSAYESTLPNGLNIVFIDFTGVLFPEFDSNEKEREAFGNSSLESMLRDIKTKVGDVFQKIESFKGKVVVLTDENDYESRRQTFNYVFIKGDYDRFKKCEVSNNWEAYFKKEIIFLPMSRTTIKELIAKPVEQSKIKSGFFSWPSEDVCPTSGGQTISDACLKYFTIVNFLNYFIVSTKMDQVNMSVKLHFITQSDDKFLDIMQSSTRSSLFDDVKNPFTLVLTKFEVNTSNKSESSRIYSVKKQLDHTVKLFDKNYFGQDKVYVCDISKAGFQHLTGGTMSERKTESYLCDVVKTI